MRLTTDAVLLGAWAWYGKEFPNNSQERGQNCDYSPLLFPKTEEEEGVLNIWDVGCGTGILALMLAQRFPTAHLLATDIDPLAVSIASHNVKKSPWSERIRVCRSDITKTEHPLSSEGARVSTKFSLIVSNPPYYSDGPLSPNERRSLARYGYNQFNGRTIFAQVAPFLNPEGRLVLVTPAEQLEELRLYSCRSLFALTKATYIHPTPSKRANVVLSEWAFLHQAINIPEQVTHLSIHNQDSTEHTEEYKLLTAPFYRSL